MNIRTACLSNQGGRSCNDDTAAVFQKDGCVRVFVGDGLGGYAGGQQASQAAARVLEEEARRGSLLTDERLTEAAAQANRAVRQLQEESHGRMKTTLVFLNIEDSRARWMHIGDSRLYHFQNGALICQTMDHSVSQMAVLMGEITPAEIRFHEDRNRVLRALGAENAKPELSPTVMLTSGVDVFLLCTDGFWEYVMEDEMEKALQSAKDPQQWLEAMEKTLHTRVNGENDNYTAAAVFC